ncbi:hypothetical protein G6F23_014875 [Rhizopus arrhizus]|nr:hypothetical protein G6F23_014875 [Rhizopus arrhizus]
MPREHLQHLLLPTQRLAVGGSHLHHATRILGLHRQRGHPRIAQRGNGRQRRARRLRRRSFRQSCCGGQQARQHHWNHPCPAPHAPPSVGLSGPIIPGAWQRVIGSEPRGARI